MFNHTHHYRVYLVEVEDELKFFVTQSNNVESLHNKVYNEFNVVWTSDISEFTKLFIETYFMKSENQGFYQSLESVDIDEMKNVINKVNGSLNEFKDMFNEEFTNIKTLITSVINQTNEFIVGEKIFISTRNGKMQQKNHQLRQNPKLPSIWNNVGELDTVIPNTNIAGSSDSSGVSAFDGSSELYATLSNFDSKTYAPVEIKHECFIYYNTHFNKVVTLINQLDSTEINEIFPELKYVINIEGKQDDIDSLKDALENNYFFNLEQLEGFIKFYKTENKITEKQIKKCLNTNFLFDNNVENRIKFTKLYNKLVYIMGIDCDVSSKKVLKQMLPRILKEMKLSKKRYSDGNYWYGITLKPLYNTKKHIVDSEQMEKLLEDKIHERANLKSTTPTIKERLENREYSSFAGLNEDKGDDMEKFTIDMEQQVVVKLDRTSDLSDPLSQSPEFKNFLEAGYHIGVDTQTSSLRNSNLQFRSEPSNPQTPVSVWNNSTIMPKLDGNKLVDELDLPPLPPPPPSQTLQENPIDVLTNIGETVMNNLTSVQKKQLLNLFSNQTQNLQNIFSTLMIPPDSPAPSFEIIDDEDAPIN